MPFTVKDFRDLIRILEKHPEWQAELRRLILTDELLALPELIRELINIQRQTVERLLALGQHVQALAEAQRHTEERVSKLEEQVQALAEAQRRTEEQIRALAEAQRHTEEQIRALVEVQRRMEERVQTLADKLGDVQGQVLEWHYREHAPAYFDDLLRRIHVLSTQELAHLLDEPLAKGVISRAERKDVLMSDVVLRGRRWVDGAEAYLIAEISVGIGEDDVERAVRRAELLERALERPVIAAVAGRGITPQASILARERGVWRVLDGTPIAPEE